MTTKVIEKNGFHRRVRTWSYVIVLCEAGGSRVKAVRLDGQTSMGAAKMTALKDNQGWRFKGLFSLSERDFEGGEKNEGKDDSSGRRDPVRGIDSDG